MPPYYSWDLQQLAGDAPAAVRQLDRKIAVLYIEGNKFSDRQQQAIGRYPARQEEAQRQFDREIQARRKAVLRRLIDGLMKDAKPMMANPRLWGGPNQRSRNPPREMHDDMQCWFNWVERRFDYSEGARGRVGWGAAARFGTLMRGGDKMMWVVPAWKGWEVLTRFFDPDPCGVGADFWKVPALGEDPLTHSAGLVFCHCNAPIRRIKTLAQELVALCKKRELYR